MRWVAVLGRLTTTQEQAPCRFFNATRVCTLFDAVPKDEHPKQKLPLSLVPCTASSTRTGIDIDRCACTPQDLQACRDERDRYCVGKDEAEPQSEEREIERERERER